MKEKKLTDEEIVKALDICYNSTCCTNECPYFNKNGRNFCMEDKAFYKGLNDLIHRQKAEIERLTEERNDLEQRYLQESKERCEFEEKYKKIQHAHNIGLGAQRSQWEKKLQQAVKDTAKEIFSFIVNQYDGEYFLHNVEQFIAEKYGVEVE